MTDPTDRCQAVHVRRDGRKLSADAILSAATTDYSRVRRPPTAMEATKLKPYTYCRVSVGVKRTQRPPPATGDEPARLVACRDGDTGGQRLGGQVGVVSPVAAGHTRHPSAP